jgi:hypothetical protein
MMAVGNVKIEIPIIMDIIFTVGVITAPNQIYIKAAIIKNHHLEVILPLIQGVPVKRVNQ